MSDKTFLILLTVISSTTIALFLCWFQKNVGITNENGIGILLASFAILAGWVEVLQFIAKKIEKRK